MAQGTTRVLEPQTTLLPGVGFTFLGLALGGLLIAAGNGVYALEGSMSTVARLLPVGYAFCSLPCHLPIFLVVAGSALAAGGVVGAATQFVAYAVGMGTVLTAVVVAAAFFQTAVARFVRSLVPFVHRLAASFLLGAGI